MGLRGPILAALVTAAAFAAAGCGSENGGEGSGSTRAESGDAARARYVRQADAFCKSVQRGYAKIPPLSQESAKDLASAGPRERSFLELSRFTNAILVYNAKHAKRFESIPRPKDDKLVKRWYDAYHETFEALRQLHQVAAAQDVGLLTLAAQRNAQASREYQKLSGELGFKVCGATIS